MFRVLMLVFALGTLSACAGQQQPIAIPQNVATIVVAGSAGDQIYLDNLTYAGIGSTSEADPVPSWNFAQMIFDTVRQTLLDNGYLVAEGRMDAGAMAEPVQYRTKAQAFSSGFAKTGDILADTFDSRKSDDTFPVSAIKSNKSADLYLVFVPSQLVYSGHEFYGLGLARRNVAMGVIHSHWLHAGYRILVIDREGKLLGVRRGTGETIRQVSGDWWAEKLVEMTPPQQDQLRQALGDMLQASVRQTLADMALTKQ